MTGLWLENEDPSDNVVRAFYVGDPHTEPTALLDEVHFADGIIEKFVYLNGSGRLQGIEQKRVDGSPGRMWTPLRDCQGT
jgi:hypothetical protein